MIGEWILIENYSEFIEYKNKIESIIRDLGYEVTWVEKDTALECGVENVYYNLKKNNKFVKLHVYTFVVSRTSIGTRTAWVVRNVDVIKDVLQKL